MTKLPRAVVLTLPAVALLAACAPAAPDSAPSPSPTITLPVSSPSPTATTLPAGRQLTEWAAIALPENRAGGPGPVVREVAAIDPERAASLDITRGEGLWELTFTCQSADGAPVTYRLVAAAASGGDETLACSVPGERQTERPVILYDGGSPASLQVSGTSEAVLAYEVRPHVEPAR